MPTIAIENVRDRLHAMAGRCIRQAAFVLLCSCMLGSVFYAARLIDRMQETGMAERWVVTVSVVPHQTPVGIDNMFKH